MSASTRTKRCTRCGTIKPVDQFYADSSHLDNRTSRCKPCIAEAKAQWIKDNHERFLELERARGPYKRAHRNNARRQCPECGQPMGAGTGYQGNGVELCRDCWTAKNSRQRHERCARIQAMWLAGKTLREIAEALDSTPGSIGVTIVRMRQKGWDVPYRYRRRIAA